MNTTLAFKVAVLKLLLQGTALANVFDNAASSPITNLYLSLLTGDPGTSNDQTVNETTYTGYARLAVARTSGGWSVDATTAIVTPAATLEFGTPSAGSGTITHAGIGKSSSGAGYLFMVGTVTPNIIITLGVPPRLTTASQVAWTS